MKTFEASFIVFILALKLSAADLPTPLSALLDEATRNNPDILAARRGWQAATQVPSQVSTPPDPQVTIQHVSVGSPRPFAGFSNSDFSYIGFGISQDLPYPGKLKLKGEAAQQEASVSREKFEAVSHSAFKLFARYSDGLLGFDILCFEEIPSRVACLIRLAEA